MSNVCMGGYFEGCMCQLDFKMRALMGYFQNFNSIIMHGTIN